MRNGVDRLDDCRRQGSPTRRRMLSRPETVPKIIAIRKQFIPLQDQ
jgi:hypothetical protein